MCPVELFVWWGLSSDGMTVLGSVAIVTGTVEGKLWVPVGHRRETFFGTEGEWCKRVTADRCWRICGTEPRCSAHRLGQIRLRYADGEGWDG